MASSRHLKGSVLSRVRDLLKSGVMKEKPVWFDVMERFPPLVEADLSREAERGRVKKIVYPEDDIRRKFSSKYELEAISLWESSATKNTYDRFVEKCQELIDEGSSESQAFEKAARLFEDELTERKASAPETKRAKRQTEGSSLTSQTLYDFLNLKEADSIKDE